jgi:hypothetical protein
VRSFFFQDFYIMGWWWWFGAYPSIVHADGGQNADADLF